jgi:hypothetical protein
MPKFSMKKWSKLILVCLTIGSTIMVANTINATAADDLTLALAVNSLKTYAPLPVFGSENNLQQIPAKITNQTTLELKADSTANGITNRFVGALDPSTLLEINPIQQTILFNKGIKSYQSEDATPELPQGTTATAFAEQHLKALGLYPGDPTQLVQLASGGIMLGVYDSKTGRQANYQKTTTLRFTRTLGGLPVEGPGSRIVINLGSNGALEGLVWNWHEVSGQTIAALDVYSQRHLQGSVKKQLRNLKGLKSSKQKLVLYDDGTGNIEPVLHVVATLALTDNGKSVFSQADFYIPVLKAPKATLPASVVRSPAKVSH